MSNLEQASHKVAEQMYQSAATDAPQAAPGAQAPADAPAGDDKGGDDVIDAEYEVKE